MTRSGNQVRGLDPEYAWPAGAADKTSIIPAGQSGRWAWEDLNLRPDPYQAYSRDGFKLAEQGMTSSLVECS